MKILNWKLFLENLVGEKPISDYDDYIENMGKSIDDKLFFMNMIDFDVIVDFGCANGTFLSKVKNLKPNVKIIGYDLDQNMLNKAKFILGENDILTNDWSVVVSNLEGYKSPLLNLSSVIHEVYSYSYSKVIKKFWETQVFGGNFKYITIRDMIPSIKIHKKESLEKASYKRDVDKVRKLSNKYYLSSFEKKWGSIDRNYRAFIHFLLKYRYVDNWDREVNEDYLPVSLETMKKKIPSSYKIQYEDSFAVPFIQNQIKDDFDLDLDISTHTKMVIENLNFKK